LLVEDEDAVRAVARQVLQGHGYAVIEVARPEDALALADTSQAVDLLLTDIVMPGVGGRGARRAIHLPATRDPRAVHVRLSGGGPRFCRSRSAPRRWRRRSERCWGRGDGGWRRRGEWPRAHNPDLRSS